MIELLERVADRTPGRAAVVTHTVSRSYAELVDDAWRVAAALVRARATRLAVVDHEAVVVVPLLAGASAAGVEVTLYPPAEREEIGRLLAAFDHEVVVTDRTDLSGLGARVVPTADVLGGARPASRPGIVAERPHLVLTTGTTGAPRGVRHDWTRLAAGASHVSPVDDQRWLLAYGLHQFAGLQVLLHVFAAGATLVAPAPRRPSEGLAAMRTLGVTHASATPTYWRFVVAEMRSDGGSVPALRQVTLGGEAIPGPLLEVLRQTFTGASVSQVYAASEFGSTGSVRDGRPGLSVDVLERGDAAAVDLRVVDGELWVRSCTGMLGYYGEPPVDADGWRPTGDLVEIVDDRVVFRGRSSDVINVGGVKVHPLPVEERVAAVPGVALARVHARPNAMTGSIVALEVVPTPGTDLDVLKLALRAACADLPAAARPRSTRFVETLETTGGKIVRRQAQ